MILQSRFHFCDELSFQFERFRKLIDSPNDPNFKKEIITSVRAVWLVVYKLKKPLPWFIIICRNPD